MGSLAILKDDEKEPEEEVAGSDGVGLEEEEGGVASEEEKR